MAGSGLVRLSAALALIAVASKLLGFARDVAISAWFGASRETDAFYLVFAVLVTFATVVAATLPKVVVPAFQQVPAESRDGLAIGVLVATFGVTLLLSVACYVAADPLAGWLAPAFDDGDRALVARLLRIQAVVLPSCGVAGAVTAWAQARHHFQLAQWSTVLLNAGVLVAVPLAGREGGVEAAAWGLAVGAVLQTALLALYPRLSGARVVLPSGAIRTALPLLGPLGMLVVFSHTGGYVAMLVDRWFAALLPDGAYSCLGYAQRVALLPNLILSSSLLVALLPAMSQRAGSGDEEGLRRLTERGVRISMLAVLPFFVPILAVPRPLTDAAYGRGAFTGADAALTASLLVCMVPTVLAEVVRTPIATAFFGRSQVRVPLVWGALRIVSMLVVYPLVYRTHGARGLALALSGIDLAVLLVVLFAARRRLGVDVRALASFFARVAVAAAAGVGAVKALHAALPGSIVGLGAACAGGGLLTVMLAAWLRVDEARDGLQWLRRRLGDG